MTRTGANSPPNSQAEQDEQLIRDVERRHPELAETIRNDLALRHRFHALGEELPDDLKAELAEVDYEQRLSPAELLALASDIHRQAQRRIQRLIRRFDELTGFSRRSQEPRGIFLFREQLAAEPPVPPRRTRKVLSSVG